MLFSPFLAHFFLPYRKLPSAHSQLLRGAIMTPVVAAKKLSNSIPRHSFRPSTAVERSKLFPKKQTIFAQGDSSDAVFYIKEGKLRLTVVSKSGKEATIGILNKGDFLRRRLPYRAASPPVLRNHYDRLLRDEIDKKSMIEVLHRERAFSDMFVAYLLNGTSDTKRIWLTSFSIPVKKDWPGYCYCWLISARTACPRL